MRALIFSHGADYDGWTSAAICDQLLRYTGWERSIIGVDYSSSMMPSLEHILALVEGFEVVFLCDLTFPPATMSALRDTGKFHWVDHHFTAIEDSAKHGYDDLPGLRSTDFAACELTFRYLTDTFTNLSHLRRSHGLSDETPELISLIGRHDTFRKDEEWDTRVLPMHCYLTSISQETSIGSPGFSAKWEELMNWGDIEIEANITLGAEILRYRRAIDAENRSAIHEVRFTDFPDMRFLALNGGKGVDGFAGIDPTGFDGMTSYRFDGSEWSFGLYGWPSSPDLSVIAKSFGGGGHRHACGFRLSELSAIEFSPYTKPEANGAKDNPQEPPYNHQWRDLGLPTPN